MKFLKKLKNELLATKIPDALLRSRRVQSKASGILVARSSFFSFFRNFTSFYIYQILDILTNFHKVLHSPHLGHGIERSAEGTLAFIGQITYELIKASDCTFADQVKASVVRRIARFHGPDGVSAEPRENSLKSGKSGRCKNS